MDTFLNLDKIKNQVTENLINDIVVKETTTDEEAAILKEELTTKVLNREIVTSIDDTATMIKANTINKHMDEINIDLVTLFCLINELTENIANYNATNIYNIRNVLSRIKELRDKIESCKYSLSYVHMPRIILENFRNANRFDKTRSLQKDREDQWIESSCYALHSYEESNVRLPLLKRDNVLRYENKVPTANIKKSFQLGQGLIDYTDEENGLDNVIDGNTSTYWNETILTDAPLKTSFVKTKPAFVFVKDNYFYDIDKGAVTELEIDFESVNNVNEITITPFTKYPIDIVAIRYKISDDDNEELKEIVYPENPDEQLRNVFTKEKVSFRFPDIICKKIYILLNQKHYVRKSYIYNPSEVHKNTLWFSSVNNKRDKTVNAVFKPVYYDRDKDNQNLQQVNDRIVKYSNYDLATLVENDNTLNRKVIKYEYNQGLYEIECFNNHYNRTGFFITKDLDIEANIKDLQITTDEKHQKDALGHYATDIEYYVTSSENPTKDDWEPILPANKTIINSELLFITGGTRAYFRFEAEEVYEVMKNGEPITDKISEYEIFKNEKTGNYWCIQIFNYSYDAVYSIKYKPAKGYNKINYISKVTTSIETFKGKNETFFKLKYNPYLDLENTYCSCKLVNTEITETHEEINATNVTNLENAGASYKNFDVNTSEFQFYAFNNTVYFNRAIPPNYIVEISYKHLVSSVKLKALFRRNSTKDGWLTPILNQIKFDISTF